MYKNLYNQVVSSIIDLIFPESDISQKVKNFDISDFKSLPRPFIYGNHKNSLWSYKDPYVKEIVWQIKYYENDTFIEIVGKLLSEIIMNNIISVNDSLIVLVPVPLSKERLSERGYNQAEKISEAMYNNLSNICRVQNAHNLIRKHKHTESQTNKNKSERSLNLKDSFSFVSLETKLSAEETYIIVDDVYTTGATMNEISSLLKSKGARKVHSVTIAH